MTKSEAYKQFSEHYSKLKDSDREIVSRLSLKFLDETFIVKEKESDKKDYLKASELLNVLRPFFAFIDFDLSVDRERGVMYIRTTQDSNRIRFKKLETIAALILRYIFDDESSKASLNSVISTTVGHLASEISKTDIYSSFDGRSVEFREALKTLRRYKIIDFDGDITLGTTPIVIYKSIVLIVDTNSIDEINTRLDRYKGDAKDEDNQETETD